MPFIGDDIKGDSVNGDKILGDKNIYEINRIDLDIGILKDILENNPTLIKSSLKQLNTITSEFSEDERTIPINEKNSLNGLSDFYENFIKREEQKLASIDKFFKENDYLDDIEEASDSIRMFIFTYANKSSKKLESSLFNTIVQFHTEKIIDIKQKSIMKLIIFYLYRYCYIGLKDV